MKVSKTVLLLENKIDQILRDQHVIGLLSKNINTAINIQSFVNRRLEGVLKLVDIATLKSLNDLFESINQLEKESIVQKEKIANLEELLKKSIPVSSPKKSKLKSKEKLKN